MWDYILLGATILFCGWVVGLALVSAFALNRIFRVNRRIEQTLWKFDCEFEQHAKSTQTRKGSHRE